MALPLELRHPAERINHQISNSFKIVTPTMIPPPPHKPRGVSDIELDSIVDPENTLVYLARTLEWPELIKRFERDHSLPFNGAVLSRRLLIGLIMLRQMYGLSDATLFNLWSENPHFQYFCGAKRFQRRPQFDQFLLRMLPPLLDEELHALLGSRVAAVPQSPVPLPSAISIKVAKEASLPLPQKTKPATPPKITDVAKRAGVSVKTVSLVLNRHPNVSERTRRVVREAARYLSYQPNVFARGLATLQSNLVAILYAGEGEFISALESGAVARCREAGFQVLVESLDPYTKDIAEQTQRLITRTALHGVIVVPPLCDNPGVIDVLIASNIRFVTISSGRQNAQTPNVGVDDLQIGYDVTAHLLQHGHRRIGFIAGLPDHLAAAKRWNGYCAALKDFGVPVDEKLFQQGQFTLESGREAAKALLHMKKRPTAIFATSDQMAAGVFGEAFSMGISIPDQLSVAGVDDSVIAQIVWPQLTTCHQPIKKMAYAALSILLLSEQDESPQNLVLDHKLVIRNSTSPLSESDQRRNVSKTARNCSTAGKASHRNA